MGRGALTMKAKKTSRARSARAKSPQSATDGRFDRVIAKLAGVPEVAEARMFGSSGLKTGGKVFAMLVKGELVVKLPRERVDALIASGEGRHFDPGHGRVMKEWVAVPPRHSGDWLALAREAKDFVAGS